MESFIVPVVLNTDLYRSDKTAERFKNKDKNKHWFCFNPNDTYGYGPVTGKFKTIVDLKLIDITSPLFYYDFVRKIEILSINDEDIRNIKSHALFAIGFSDFEIYKDFATKLTLPINDSSNILVNLTTQFMEIGHAIL